MSPLLGSAFAAAERLGGAPVWLYTFARGSVMWRYTSDGLPLTVAATGISYNAAKIEHEEIQRKDESGAVDIKVTLGSRLAVVAALRDGSTEPMVLAIHKYHPSAGGMPARFAYGDVGSPSLDSASGKCELVLHTSEGDFDVDVPRTLITVQCQKATYSSECGVRWQDFAIDADIVALGPRTIQVDSVGAAADGYYDNGIVKLNRESVHIERQVGTILTVFNEIPSSFTVGTTVKLLAGDDKQAATCATKFGNIRRFLGFPWLPAKNPLLNRDGGIPQIFATWDEPLPSGPYTTPAQWFWYDGDSVTDDGAGHVQSWDDKTGNGRHSTQSSSSLRMDYVAPAGSPPSPFHDTGLILFGSRDLAAPANTLLNLPSFSSLSQADIFFTFRIGWDAVLALLTLPPADREMILYSIHQEGHGGGYTRIQGSDGHIISGTGLSFPTLYNLGKPSANLLVDCVYNETIGPTRWTARLNGVVLFTRDSSYDGHSNSFSQIQPTLGGVGSLLSTLLGTGRRFLVYPSVLSPADRAAALAYMQTGVGSPP